MSRLKFTVELLKATQIGRLIKHISNKPPSNGECVSLTSKCDRSAASERSLPSLARTAAGSTWSIGMRIVSNGVRLNCPCGLAAIKSVAQNLESQWRDMISKQQLEEDGLEGQDGTPFSSPSNPHSRLGAQGNTQLNTFLCADADSKQRKRKQTDSATSREAPPAKKQALSSSPAPKVVVKKEPVKANASAVVKDAKSDTSFFSAPKAKPKLPSFTKKAPPPPTASAASSVNVAQPMSSLNPFADALKSIDKSRNGTPPASIVGAPSASAAVAVSSPAETAANKKRRVTFAPDDRLVSIRWIERAIYDDDADVSERVAESGCLLEDVDALGWFVGLAETSRCQRPRPGRGRCDASARL